MNKLIATLAIAAVACGCITINKNDGGDACIAPNIAKDTVHEKYEISGDAVTAEDNLNVLFNFITWGSSATHHCDAVCGQRLILNGIEKAKNGAYANACDAAQCDSISAARYTVTVNDYFVFKKINAKVTGYPTKLTGVEIMPPCPMAKPEHPAK